MWCEIIDKFPSELAFWGVQRSFDEHHAWILLDHVLDLSECLLLLLVKEVLYEVV